MLAGETIWQITPEDLAGWIVFEDDRLLVVNKPALVVCHPSKNGPWSSLIGACREYTGLERLHMPSRLDRETSGVVVFAKDREMGSRLQRAMEHRQVRKTYLAILTGILDREVRVDQPIGREGTGPVRIRQWVMVGDPGAATAVTHFYPLHTGAGFTLARVVPETGRLHQIRVHAAWMGHALVGDKLYGPDERLFLTFIESGWGPELSARLLLPRQALHASRMEFQIEPEPLVFEAPLAADLEAFAAAHGMAVGGEIRASN